MPWTFPPSHRLKSTAEFQRVFDRKRSVSDARLIVYACENGRPHPRLGISVSRKVGNAVARNRYKRLLREVFRLSQDEIAGGIDYVVIPRPGPQQPGLAEIAASFRKLASEAARRLRSSPPPTSRPLPSGGAS